MSGIVTDISADRLPWRVASGFINTYTITLTLNGSAYSIASKTLSLQIRRIGSETNFINLTEGSGITNGGASGIITIELTAAQSATLGNDQWMWQLSVSPDATRWFSGTITATTGPADGDTASSLTVPLTLAGSNVSAEITLATPSHYRGVYASLAALESAVPAGEPGDYADVDEGVGETIQRYIWDDDDEEWVLGGGSGDAANITFTPASGIAATNVQAAIVEAKTDAQTYADTKVAQTITNGVTDSAPSQDAVFDALDLKANLASPALTGTPIAPTAAAFDNSAKLATTAYADRKVDKIKNTLGTLFNNTGAFTSGNYTQNGTTFTVNASTISGNSGGVAGTYTNNIGYNYTTLLHNYVVEATYTLATVGAASTGLGFGVKGTGLSAKRDFIIVYDCSSGANAGKILTYTVLNGSATLISTSVGSVAPASSDVIQVRMVAGRGKISIEFYNVTQNKYISNASLSTLSAAGYGGQLDQNYGVGGLAGIGRFTIWNFGFQGTISTFKATSNEIVGAKYAAIGNSIAYGSYVTDVGQSWADVLARDLDQDVVVHAANSLVSADYLNVYSEMINLAPENVIIEIGVNDILGGGGQSISALETNLPTIITAFQNAGITVYLTELLPTAANGGINTHNTWLRANYGSQVIPLFQAFTDGTANGSLSTTYSSDGLHPNAAAHHLLASLIEQKLASGYTVRTGSRPPVLNFPVNSYGNNYGRDMQIGTLDAFVPIFLSGGGKFHFFSKDATLGGVMNVVTNASGAGTGAMYLKNGSATGYSSYRMADQSNAQFGIFQLDNSTKEVAVRALSGSAYLSLYSYNNLKVFLGSSDTQVGNWTTAGLFIGGSTTPTARLHLAAGTTAASTAPLKLTTGTLMTAAEAGAMEYNNTPHFTNSDATRRHIVLAPNTTKVTAAAPYTNDGYVVVNIGGTDFKIMTTA